MKIRYYLVVLGLALWGPAVAFAAAQNAYDLFQKALTADRAHGDLETAIDLYRQVVEAPTAERALAAKALFQIGNCYERLGHDKAEEAYSRVVTEFADQVEIASLARDRLGALSDSARATTAKVPVTTEPVATRLLSQDEMSVDNFYFMRPSPDGNRVAYSAIGTAEGGLFVRDLRTGETTRLRETRFTLSPVWSPDEKKIAYVCGRFRETGVADAAIRIIDVETQESRDLFRIENLQLDRVLDWSPGGRRLLANLERPDKTFSLVLIDVATGKRTPLITQGWLSDSTASFSPDGRYIAFSAVADANQDIYLLAVDGSAKIRLTSDPGQERFPLWSPDGETIVYQREDGAWAVGVVNGRPGGAPRLLDSKPFDQPLAWTRKGGFTYVGYNSFFSHYRLPVDPDKGEATGALESIEVTLKKSDRMAWSPDMKSMAFSGYDHKIHVFGVKDRSLRSYPIDGLTRAASSLSWSHDGREVLFVPYRGGGGLTVKALDPSDGTIRDLFPTIDPAGRFAISPDGGQMVFYKGEFGDRQLTVAEVGAREGVTLAHDQDPEGVLSNWVRPVLSPDGKHVLFGRQTFDDASDDSLWIISTDGTGLRKLASVQAIPSKDGQGFETALQSAVWSPSGRHVAYEDSQSLFVVNVETGAQRELSLPPELGWLAVQQWAPDGKSIAIGTQRARHELWSIRNLVGPDAGSENIASR